MATRLDGPEADGVNLAVNFVFTDLGESYRLWIENAVLHHRKLAKGAGCARRRHGALDQGISGCGSPRARPAFATWSSPTSIDVDGSRTDLLRFFSLLDAPDPNFAIVRP